jgi:hypothetical protein
LKILLIAPPIEDFFFTPQRAYPLGLLYLAASLKQAGFDVKVLNTLEGNKKFSLKTPEEFSYLKRYYRRNKSPFCLFDNYYHFGMSWAEIEEEIAGFKPSIVGISSNFSPYFDTALGVAGRVKKIDKRIPVVLGGRFPAIMPEFVLGQENVDFIIRGEAEQSMVRLCEGAGKGILPKIDGLGYKIKNNLNISRTSGIIRDLNSLPFPERSLIDSSRYIFKGMLSAALLTSRGCSLGCKFCAIKERFRFRRADNVFKEIEECYSLGIRHFNFEDDNINFNPELGKLLDLLIAGYAGKIKISFMNGVLSRGLTKKICRKLSAAGLTHLDFSIAGAQSAPRNNAKRKTQERNIFSIAGRLAENIPSTVHFIIGLPGQRFGDCLRDIKSLAAENVMLGPSIFYPVIESGLFNELKEKFSFAESDYLFFRSSAACFDKDIGRDGIFSLVYLCRIVNFIKSLMGKFLLNSENFPIFLKEKTLNSDLSKAVLTSARVDREALGIILLVKLLREGKIFRVEETCRDKAFRYEFFEENFITPENNFRDVLNKLVIKGLTGNTVNLRKVVF